MKSSSKVEELKQQYEDLTDTPISRQLLILPTDVYDKDTFEEAYYDANDEIFENDDTFETVPNDVIFLLFITSNF